MALTSTITNDLVAGTSTLIINSGSQIENVVYTNSSQTLLFSTQSSYSLSASDFLAFAAILDLYKRTLLSIYNAPLYISGSYTLSMHADTNYGISLLTFIYQKGNHPLYSISGTYPSGSLTFAFRNQSTTLTIEEWTQYHDLSSHFEYEVKKLYKL